MPVQGRMYADADEVAEALMVAYGDDRQKLKAAIAEALHLTLREESLGWFWRTEYEAACKELDDLGVT